MKVYKLAVEGDSPVKGENGSTGNGNDGVTDEATVSSSSSVEEQDGEEDGHGVPPRTELVIPNEVRLHPGEDIVGDAFKTEIICVVLTPTLARNYCDHRGQENAPP